VPTKHFKQTVDHLKFRYEKLKNERDILKNNVLKKGNWPLSKSELINRNFKQLFRYINSMDFEKMAMCGNYIQRVKIVINNNIIKQITDFKYLGYRIAEYKVI